MMTKEQEEAVKLVYRNFLHDDYNRVEWTDVDSYLYDLDYLSDNQTILETEAQLFLHSMGKVKCNEDHGEKECLLDALFEAVRAILDLFIETQQLHIKNKYVLQHYLLLSHKKRIFTDTDK